MIGAGFSGLVSAYYLARAGFTVDVFEAKSGVGGMIQSPLHLEGIVETAANGILNSALVEELFASVGVEQVWPMKEARRRFIFTRGVPRRWPLSFHASMRILKFVWRVFMFRLRVRLGFNASFCDFPRKRESVREWGERVLGAEACRYFLEAGLQGIYAGDPERLSAPLILGAFLNPPPQTRRAQRPGTVSARLGLGELLERLRIYLERKGVQFHLDEPVSLQSAQAGNMPPSTNSSDFAKADVGFILNDRPVVIATSAPDAAKLLADVDHERVQALQNIEMLPLVAANIFYKQSLPTVRGFGCLFPPVEKRFALGVLFYNSIFEGRVKSGFLENWILGGALGRDLSNRNDEDILNAIASERLKCFGGSGVVSAHYITRWPKAIPHYTVDLEEQLPRLIGVRQNVALIGNYLGRIGLAKILEQASELPALLLKSGSWAIEEDRNVKFDA